MLFSEVGVHTTKMQGGECQCHYHEVQGRTLDQGRGLHHDQSPGPGPDLGLALGPGPTPWTHVEGECHPPCDHTVAAEEIGHDLVVSVGALVEVVLFPVDHQKTFTHSAHMVIENVVEYLEAE